MPEVSFYILPTESPQERYLFVCRLIEKAYRNGTVAYVLTDNLPQSHLLDDLLWVFRAGSFIPHQIYTGIEPAFESTVLIGSDNGPEQWQQMIINISNQCPQNFQTAQRIFEVLDASEETKVWGRQKYRQYQQAGITLTTHKMN